MSAMQIFPTPHHIEPLEHTVVVHGGRTLGVQSDPVGRAGPAVSAIELLTRRLLGTAPAIRIVRNDGSASPSATIHLWDYARSTRVPIELNVLDRSILAESRHAGQAYVIRVPDERNVWVIGASEQGILLGVTTLVQTARTGDGGGLEMAGVYVRDYPDFAFRAGADWLLNGEINRWSHDRGQGVEAFAELCERKIDEALAVKTNMVLFDGFGWGLDQRFDGYAELMLRLNRFARARGVTLLFGGYGASYGIAYQPGPLYEDGAYLGEVFENRESYPDGPLYRCLGFPKSRAGFDPRVLGSCRGNDDLNRLKGEDLHRFVDAIEPGALYIHHEDFGGLADTEKTWLERCPRCRERWPNDDLTASDGGAGAFAAGYAALIRGAHAVRHADSGYDARRDCQVILVSPVYLPDSPSTADWSRAIELWVNIAQQLPLEGAVQICFREVFPQQHGDGRFTDAFNAAMRQAGLDVGIFIICFGGADGFTSDHATAGTPAMNALFLGAEGICNGTGDLFREPMGLINAEYNWNAHSSGFYREPQRFDEASALWDEYLYGDQRPAELFGPSGLLEAVCVRLYGPSAGPIMANYNRLSAWVPEASPESRAWERTYGLDNRWDYLPLTWARVTALPTHWRHLAIDAKCWGPTIENVNYAGGMARLGIDRVELHRRQARRWRIVAELNMVGHGHVVDALAADPLASAVPDLEFLKTIHAVYWHFCNALHLFHEGLRGTFAGEWSEISFSGALDLAGQARMLAAAVFPRPLEPVGGEVGAARTFSERLVEAIEAWLAQPESGSSVGHGHQK